jgi:outer membrane autotransporter protein
MTDAAVLDLYGKYFWTRQAGDTVKLSTGESVRFNDTDSSRVRAGGRFSYTIDDTITPYIGAAWEYEFDGRARATTNGFSMPSPSLRGDTGVGELGLTIRAGELVSLDLGVQGYAGKREGVTGSAQVKIEF